eukprot:c34791_g1_i1.p1 GENE.c34791_g1_i1~~c34791_g1_i1.p1  ORF type:complete len:346 (+),score=12.00 c34791_g1_i1:39-1076(+)
MFAVNSIAGKLVGVIGFILMSPLLILMMLSELISENIITHFRGTNQPGGRTVVITGCDMGIGKLTAEKLEKIGYNVVALCLNADTAKQMQESSDSSRLHPLVCDVTSNDDAMWKNLYESISKIGNGKIYALINNAGVLHYGPVEWVPLKHFQLDMDVNLFGMIRTTKALLPLLRNNKQGGGRVINIASVAGFFSAPLSAPYSCSKYAVEGFSEALRRELSGFNIEVVVIEPAIMKTTMLNDYDKFEALYGSLADDVKESYGKSYLKNVVKMTQIWRTGSAITPCHPPSLVVDALLTALSHSVPQNKYRVGFDAKTLFSFLAIVPTFVADSILNLASPLPLPQSRM